MAKTYKCDFCGQSVEHEAQLGRVDRMCLPGRPRFVEIYPDMAGKEICHDCSLAEDAAFEMAKPETLKIVRQGLDKRRAR